MEHAFKRAEMRISELPALATEVSFDKSPDTPLIPIHDTPAGATFQMKVHPRARKNAITGIVGDALKLALTAPPLEGRANDACIAFLAEFLNVPHSSVTIAAGASSRNKVIRVAGVTAAQMEEKLGRVIG